MAKTEAPITLITQTKITITPPEMKPKPSPRKARVAKVVKVQKVEPKVVEKAPKVKAMKPPVEVEPGLAAKNQEAVRAGTVPNRSSVPPGRYDMLLY